VRHITRFLLELGSGFAFVGRQFRLDVNGNEFFIDLLFYHTRLKCYVVVELKSTAFKPEHAGQLNFYLTAVDRVGDQFRAGVDDLRGGLQDLQLLHDVGAQLANERAFPNWAANSEFRVIRDRSLDGQ